MKLPVGQRPSVGLSMTECVKIFKMVINCIFHLLVKKIKSEALWLCWNGKNVFKTVTAPVKSRSNRCNGHRVQYVLSAIADIVSLKIVEPIAIVMFSILLCAFITPCKWYKRFWCFLSHGEAGEITCQHGGHWLCGHKTGESYSDNCRFLIISPLAYSYCLGACEICIGMFQPTAVSCIVKCEVWTSMFWTC